MPEVGKYVFSSERMQEVYDSLDETGGMLMKDSEFRFWVEKVVEEEKVKYLDVINRRDRRISHLSDEILGKEKLIKDLLCTIRVYPDRIVHEFSVSLALLQSEFKDEVIKDIVASLYKIAEKGIIPREIIIDEGQPPKEKEGRWKRAWEAFKN